MLAGPESAPKFEPKRALAYFVYVKEHSLTYMGGGALLSSTCAITKTINILSVITKRLQRKNLRVATRSERLNLARLESHHAVLEIKPEKEPSQLDQDTIALVIISHTIKDHLGPKPPEHYIPLATRSYAPGKHEVTEFFVRWDAVRKLQLLEHLIVRNFSSFKYFQFIYL